MRRKHGDLAGLVEGETSYGAIAPLGTSIPGEPDGMPAPANPTTFGRSLSSRLMSSRDVALDHIAANHAGVTRTERRRDAFAVLDRGHIRRLGDGRVIAGFPQMRHPFHAAATAGIRTTAMVVGL